MKNRLIISITMVLLTFIIASCNNSAKTNDAETASEAPATGDATFLELKDEQVKAAEIETDSIQTRSLSAILKVNGILDVPPQNLHSINAPYGGFIKETEMLEGTRVQKGQVIAVLQHPDYIEMQQEYMNSVSQLAFLEKDYQRQMELQKGEASAAKVLQKSEAEYQSKLAEVKALEAKFALIGIDKEQVKAGKITSIISLKSPINGYVTTVNANIGKYVSPNDVIFEIVNTEHLHVELTVFEKDIAKIHIGQKIRFTLANDPAKERTAKVYLIGRQFDASRSIRIHGHLDKEDSDLLPGMYVNATIELGATLGTTVPRESVVMSEGKKYVFLKNNVCPKHPECSAHESCPVTENCKEHPDCEAHEKIPLAQVDKQHSACEAHESCKSKSPQTRASEEKEAGYQTFSKIEVETNVADEKFVSIAFLSPVSPDKKIVTKGAFFLLSQSKTGGMDACGQ